MAAATLDHMQALKRAEQKEDDWVSAARKFQGRGVSYLSAPTGTATYCANSLVR